MLAARDRKVNTPEEDRKYDVPLDTLILSTRTINALNAAGYKFVRQVDRLSYKTLMRIPGLAQKGIKELQAELRQYNDDLRSNDNE